ncbi:hypothetical protein [Palleronia rufa]|nr:hypothetical protein [Palleronia rufa]
MSRKRLGEDVTEGSEDVPGRFVVNPIVARAWHPAPARRRRRGGLWLG